MLIPMTHRRPVEIDPEAWPVIAEARETTPEPEISITIRRHADGRHLVYGGFTGRYGERAEGHLTDGAKLEAMAFHVAYALSAVRLLGDLLGQLPPERL